MPRRSFGLVGSSALNWSLGLAVVAACNVYDSSLLTGRSEGQGGTSSAGEGSGGESGTSTGGSSGDSGATTGGGTSGKGGSSGTGTGGSKGGSAGDTGGTDQTGGDAGEPPTGGTAGSGTGSGGSAGNAGAAGTGTSGGSGGDAGSGGACGKCGCGKAETGDMDMDGVLDCNDMCPDLNDAHCAVLRSGLVHRYSFNGTGTAVMDTKGTAHGTATGVNAALSGSGTIVLAGGISPQSSDPNKQYVDLPDDLLSGLTNATFEAWMTWTTPTNWQRLFDFGSAATGTSGAYVFLALRVSTSGGCRVAISTAGSAAETTAGGAQVNGPVITTAVEHHFVFSIDDTGNTASLHVDGVLGSTVGFTGTIASLVGTNNWLGRSNYTTASDAYLGGTINEFRIYNVALTPAQLQTSLDAGPNATIF